VGGGRDGGLSTLTRDYSFEIDHRDGKLPLLTVFGGKLTTHRKLAEKALDMLKPFHDFPRDSRSETEVLPGGDPIDVAREYPKLPPALAARIERTYGSRTRDLLSTDDMGRDLGCGLHEREIEFLRSTEWATTPDDILTRRTKLILRMTPKEIERVREMF
jgi:glycerol-3-phosphate dehydrogenase